MKKQIALYSTIGCGLAAVLLSVGLGVDALLALLVTKAFPQVGFLQAFVVLIVASVLLGVIGRK